MKVRSPEQLLLFDAQSSKDVSKDLRAAVRCVVCGDTIISYRLQRVRRRSIGLQVDETGLTVRAPRWITLREINAAIGEHQRWIRSKEVEWRTRRAEPRTAVACLADGGAVQLLGEAVRIRLGASATQLDTAAAELAVAVSPNAAQPDIRDALQVWLRQQAHAVFADRVAQFSHRIDARFAGWRLSSARTQWGSCSHDGRIRLNWRLVHFALPVIDYVIAHEMAHLVELNHSPRFWKAVSHLLPGFEAARDQIKRVELAAISF